MPNEHEGAGASAGTLRTLFDLHACSQLLQEAHVRHVDAGEPELAEAIRVAGLKVTEAIGRLVVTEAKKRRAAEQAPVSP